MNYDETLDYLYAAAPDYHSQGVRAYKPGLATARALDRYFHHPHRSYHSLHVAGTNGKGTVCHTLAAILGGAGYKVGLYTSPHLTDFRERIRVNGEMIEKDYVTAFVAQSRAYFEPLSPSFFELTTALALDYFRFRKVDFAVIETGLGGRMDTTNIITPVVSAITSISLDHTQLLGPTLRDIAIEKAGIIKPDVPLVVGDMPNEEIYEVFRRRADELGAPYFRADADDGWDSLADWALTPVQRLNVRTILWVLDLLDSLDLTPSLPRGIVADGFARVIEQTGLRGRWEVVGQRPYTVLDTGHNEGAWRFLSEQIERLRRSRPFRKLILVTGFSADKDLDPILDLLPPAAEYIFTQASLARALRAETLAARARSRSLDARVCPTVADALRLVREIATEDDFIFIGGSNFIVADALPLLPLFEE
ncbi:MAG: bifunctional folylpolyglutamate synthase/dihydrofolate synthase [Tannerellaceae bacterium]|jgi:dihydrofolate synthase/folylpolyglutamate synthase|nr:bifunctional folylpolyglutamate synthase/dihydrofolate synthase [Tannerellaceae bacterium]